jgi:hypothetical protein
MRTAPTLFKLTAAPAGRRFGRSLFALLAALLASAGLVLPGFTGRAQNQTAQGGATQTEVNVTSWDAAGQTTRLQGVTAKNGILAFDTLETYERNYPVIFNMSAEQSEAWEKSLGFVSQRNIFNRIVKAEYEYLVAPYEDKSVEELKKMAPPRGHTRVYEKYLRSGLIKIQSYGRGDETYTAAIPIGAYLPVINEQGYFIVGNTVYQIKNNFIKEMDGVEVSKLRALDQAAADDAANKIKIHRVVEKSPAKAAGAASSCNYPLSSGWITGGTNRRGSITVNLTQTYFNPYPYTKVTVNYNVNVKSQKKNFWGNWVYPSCPNECWLSFSWTAVFQYISKVTLGYAGATVSPRSFSYPHPNCINDFNGSFNPITGANAPYPSSFTFTAPSGLAFLDVGFQNALWQASVPGGSSGINCSVGCP